jgi:hypothetical protein
MGITETARVLMWELDTGVRSTGTADLRAVRAVSADETWAVGFAVSAETGRRRAMVGRWHEEGFRFVRPADAARSVDVTLNGVDWAGRHVWAVGAVTDGTGGGRARIERYSRRHPAGVAVPAPAVDRDNALHAVSMLAPNDGWAVGAAGPGADFTRTMAARWDGRVWRAVPCPSPGAQNRLDAVSARTTDDVWAVGRADDAALVVHWDGKVWSRVPAPDAGPLTAVAALDRHSVWATGTRDGAGVILHWDGKCWRSVLENPGPVTEVTGVAATSEDDVWFSAYALRPTETVHIAHWDGRCVRPAFTGPLPRGHVGSALHGITAIEDRVVAVGWRKTVDTPHQLPAVLLGCSSAPA